MRCGQPPEGYATWTLRLLADKAIELNITDSIGHETVRQVLKKQAAPASEEDVGDTAEAGEFVAHREDILDTYQRPYDPEVPLVCMD